MVEAKGFNAHDGTGVSLARLGGMKCAIITKRISETVALRARDLRLEYVYMGQAYKMKAVREIMEKENIGLDEICYVGDDVIDLPVMRVCGFAVAVANARDNVKSEAHYVTQHEGGHATRSSSSWPPKGFSTKPLRNTSTSAIPCRRIWTLGRADSEG
jgi:3-deoxy-D-manno-octulosonate 8-phosphate phosphatase (KDO 8-P phosphatase)